MSSTTARRCNGTSRCASKWVVSLDTAIASRDSVVRRAPLCEMPHSTHRHLRTQQGVRTSGVRANHEEGAGTRSPSHQRETSSSQRDMTRAAFLSAHSSLHTHRRARARQFYRRPSVCILLPETRPPHRLCTSRTASNPYRFVHERTLQHSTSFRCRLGRGALSPGLVLSQGPEPTALAAIRPTVPPPRLP